ncbi:uncharacterized protein KY384_001610 [Bacidia gigantensis]|uniref:uncharacterized protein n=1 Tax=Bacidia gigantensis TaxID=2732470 RepID=UPI001D037AE7|nr:uncharacterized protein KY384_001610 [Bacidia gigantensis]KAG8533869.1 hypothetical protein KY384_001610 [Bacidia gigantensis]
MDSKRPRKDLEGIIADMASTFTRFESNINEQGYLGHQLTENLRQTSTRMAELTRRGRHQSLELEEPEQGPTHLEDILGAREAILPQRSTDSPTSTILSQPWGYIPQPEASVEASQPEIEQPVYPPLDWTAAETTANLPYETPGNPPSDLQAQVPSFFSALGQDAELRDHPQQQTRDEVHEYRIPDGQMLAELPAPGDYSHHETSFTRRLLRSSLEASLRMLYNPSSSPSDVKRVGRFSFCYMQERAGLGALQSVWSRPLHANLEYWNGPPFYHVGGAGLHYPREFWDVDAEPPPSNWAATHSMGPQPLRDPKWVEALSMGECQKLELAEVTGEWFDSNDVEQYLRTKGVFLDAQSRVAEVQEVDDVPELEPETMVSPPGSTAGPRSPQYWSESFPPDQYQQRASEPGLPSNDPNWWKTMSNSANQSIDENAIQDWDPTNFDWGSVDLSDNLSEPVKPKKMVDVDVFLESECPRSKRSTGVMLTSFRYQSDHNMPWKNTWLSPGQCGHGVASGNAGGAARHCRGLEFYQSSLAFDHCYVTMKGYVGNKKGKNMLASASARKSIR